MSNSDIETVRLVVRDELSRFGNGNSDNKKLSHQDLENEVMTTNFARCKNGSCGGHVLRKNPMIKEFKICDNCNSNTVQKDSDICPTCGNTDPDKFDDDSNVELENGDN